MHYLRGVLNKIYRDHFNSGIDLDKLKINYNRSKSVEDRLKSIYDRLIVGNRFFRRIDFRFMIP